MKVLVSGGAGYIGSVAVDHLLRAGHEVMVYDNLSHGHRQAVPEDAELIIGDIGDKERVKEVLANNFGAVMHFAALIEAGESMQKPELYRENNVEKSKIFFDQVVRAGIKNVVFSSTAAVYESKDEPLQETDPIGPASVYGETKRQVELYLQTLNEDEGLRAAILRYFNAAGATMLSTPPSRGEAHEPETHLIPNIIKMVLNNGSEFIINGGDYPTSDGTCIRDYIHVDDLAEAHLLALDALAAGEFEYDVFNLGNGNGFSNRQVVEVVKNITGHDFNIKTGPRREGDAAILVANSEKAKSQLGWQPKYGDLEIIVKSAWEWHKNRSKDYE
jgi:UDP-glucose 4-epimerase